MIPGSDRYQTLRSALENASDVTEIRGVLDDAADDIRNWLEASHQQLRYLLIQERTADAEALGQLMETVLQVQEGGSDDELAENRILSESMAWLVSGIGAILGQESTIGITQLENLTDAIYCPESLRWIAWYWIARAAVESADFGYAREAADQSKQIAEALDPEARCVSLCLAAEVEYEAGESGRAIDLLEAAQSIFAQVGDRPGVSAAWLACARLQTQEGQLEAARESTLRARQADSASSVPLVFLARIALVSEEIDEASQYLDEAEGLLPGGPPLARMQRLVGLVRGGFVPTDVVKGYLRLRERRPSPELVEELEEAYADLPDFLEMRDLLAHTLAKLGRDEEAVTHFEALAAQPLDPQLRSSVLLGLGCLAHRRRQSSQTGRRLQAASEASKSWTFPEGLDNEAGSSLEDAVSRAESEPILELSADDLVSEEPRPARRPSSPIHSVATTARLSSPTGPLEPTSPQKTRLAISIPTAAPKAAFTGDLQLLSVPDLLEFLKASRRTGTLVVTSDCGIGAVHLEDGMLTGGASPNSANIGQLLLDSGAITKAQLKKASKKQKSDQPEALLGAILAASKDVDRSQVQAALRKQILSVIVEIVGWQRGSFSFGPERREENVSADIEVYLDTQSILLDALRMVDEENR